MEQNLKRILHESQPSTQYISVSLATEACMLKKTYFKCGEATVHKQETYSFHMRAYAFDPHSFDYKSCNLQAEFPFFATHYN